MTAFTVWKFEDPQGAEHASSLLKDAAHDGLVKIMDHAVVSWPVGAERPTTKHGHDDTWRGTGWGFFWGLLFGMLFAVPVVGAAAGAAGGAFAKMRDGLGIIGSAAETEAIAIPPDAVALLATGSAPR